MKIFKKSIVLSLVFVMTAACSAETLIITKDGEFQNELDVSGWKKGEYFVYLYDASGMGFYYPWQGEDEIDYKTDERTLWVNGRQVGVDLSLPDPIEVEDKEDIVTAILPGYETERVCAYPNLGAVNFIGQIEEPDENFSCFPELENLRGFFFAAGGLYEAQMAELGKCKGLVVLDMGATIMPEGAMDAIAGLPNLRELNVGSVSDKEMFTLKGHKNLQSITRHWTVVDTGWVDFLESLPEIRELAIIQAEITDEVFAYLASSNRLEALYLPYAGVYGDDFETISRMTNLQELDLTGTEITDDDVKALANLTGLKSLSIGGGGAGYVTAEGLAHLRGLGKLEYLDISSTPLTDDGLKHVSGLSGLKSLNLVSTEVTDKGLKQLKKLENLKYLDLSGTIVTDKGVASLRKALPDCNVVRMY
ncbi:hypothetical protein GF359_00800 [candidate division WOR-3 bacterium]|uniref:F-box/LRR-repeat protein 15-like leucin rich repeat domain-containing protein n=1 Tax=candidate division WOR-3 bacterium TaxID=2052148 RepID=A0A9D5QC72_UNCW3|nr:hypothetical protein [candidate division WOR-3 bacterium]MBD3363732.1 hypothetical protein [candidate division WOR-3 bacterium]